MLGVLDIVEVMAPKGRRSQGALNPKDRSGAACAKLARVLVLLVLSTCVSSVAIKPEIGFAQTSDHLSALSHQVNQLYRAGKYAEAVTVAKRYVEAAKKKHGEAHIEYSSAISWLGFVHKAQGRFRDAEPLYKRALAIREKALGPDHPHVATTLNNLAGLYQSQGRYDEAIQFTKRALAIIEQARGRDHPDLANNHNYIGWLNLQLGRYAEAEQHYQRAILIREKILGPESPDYADSLKELGRLYRKQGNYANAEELLKRSLAISEKTLGAYNVGVSKVLDVLAGLYKEQGRYSEAEPLYMRALEIDEKIGRDNPDTAASLNNLADVKRFQGRYAEAEPLYKRSLTIIEKVLGPEHPHVSASLNNLALLYGRQGRYGKAEPLYKRALAIGEKALGPDHPHVATTLNNLAGLYQSQGRYREAEPLYERSLAITEKALGLEHPLMGTSLNHLAALYKSQGRYDKAEPLYKRSLAIREKALGPEHPHVGTSLNNLAALYEIQGRYGEAEPLFKRALAIWEKALGPNHPSVAIGLRNLGLLDKQLNQLRSAFQRIHKAAAIHRTRALEGVAQRGTSDAGTIGQEAPYFLDEARLAWRLARDEPARRAELIEAAFDAAQWAGRTSAAAALGQMAARFGSGDSKLARLVRTRQDLKHHWQALDKKLIEAIGASSAKRDQTTIDNLRAALTAAKKRIADFSAKLEKDFPEYAELSNPRPLGIVQARKLLGPDEVLALYLVSADESFVWAVTREAVRWQRIGVGDASMSDRVNALRRGLDPSVKGGTRGKEQRALVRRDRGEGLAYDLEAAHVLYKDLLGPVEELIKDKKRLIIVPSGPLTSLPFHVLVTEKPNQALARYEGYARAAWLIKRHAITVLPSVSSLRALRVFAAKARASEPFVGFGDPVFRQGKPRRDERKRRNRDVRAASAGPAGISGYFRGARADADKLGQLARLADTEEELKQIARSLGAPESEIRLRRQASETVVKATKLDRYRVVAFATHGLVAGELKGLAEPGLALTVPAKPTETDDGLLTASEVAQLKLNADWVLLSACNTAAGERQGAEALSGLARAFFYAGARALLVSHWPVRSDAAVRLTTGAMAELQREPGIGRAEALRRSMLALMRDGSDPTFAHPAIWAPFVVVGEGGAR